MRFGKSHINFCGAEHTQGCLTSSIERTMKFCYIKKIKLNL